MNLNDMLAIIEGILFLSGDPVSKSDLAAALDMTVEDLDLHISELKTLYNDKSRGLMMSTVGDSLRLTTKPEIFPYVERLFKPQVKARLSKAALETLAIVMFKQPVTRAEIEFIRGVNVEKVLNSLQERELIKEAGRLDTTGRPILYETTVRCLEHFGLRTYDDIPEVLKKRIS